MSTSLTDIGNLLNIYAGIPIFIAGVLGGLLNTLVFLSLQTFRQSSCAFYLTVMSVVNIGQLITGFFPRIMIGLVGVDGTEASLFYCKFRPFCFNTCLLTSLTCFLLATIDQYCATCSRPRWQQFCNIKLAQRLVFANVIIWALHAIPYFLYFNHVQAPDTNKVTCVVTNYVYAQYRTYMTILLLTGFLPVLIAAIFGWMAYYNVQQLAYRTVPLVRRELDKQLTIMVLVQVIVNIFSILPYSIVNAVATNTVVTNNPLIQEKFKFITNVVAINYYIYFASPFYIYIFASERFRRQLIHVLFARWKKPRVVINQVIPET